MEGLSIKNLVSYMTELGAELMRIEVLDYGDVMTFRLDKNSPLLHQKNMREDVSEAFANEGYTLKFIND